jgi:hypothetical protein
LRETPGHSVGSHGIVFVSITATMLGSALTWARALMGFLLEQALRRLLVYGKRDGRRQSTGVVFEEE